MKKLTPQQKRELMALAQCDLRTMKRWINGLQMKPTVKARVDAAWKRLKSAERK